MEATGWSVLGENVGKGPSVSVLHQAFMESPSHKANILGDFDRVGVGVGFDAESKMYVTVMFMKSNAPTTTTTTTIAPTPTTVPVITTTTTIVAATAAPTPTTTLPAPQAVSPARPSAPALERENESLRTLGYELSEERWIDGTFCVTIRPDGAVCVE